MITYEFAVDGKSVPFQAADNNHAIVRLTATWQKFWRGKVYSGSLYSYWLTVEFQRLRTRKK